MAPKHPHARRWHTHSRIAPRVSPARTHADARTLEERTHSRQPHIVALYREPRSREGLDALLSTQHVMGQSPALAVARVEACTPPHSSCPSAAPTDVTSLHLCGSGPTLYARAPTQHGGGTLAFARTRAVPRGAPTRAGPFPHSAQDSLAGRRTPEVAGLALTNGPCDSPDGQTANAAHPANCAQQHAARSICTFGSPSVRWEGPRPCAALRVFGTTARDATPNQR